MSDPAPMRAFLCETPEELKAHRAAAETLLASRGWRVLRRRLEASPESALGAVDEADVVLALVGWRTGPAPEPEAGDARRPWVQREVARALRRGRPLLVLMTSEFWPEREADAGAFARMADLRAELAPLALSFDPEPPEVPRFRELLGGELDRQAAARSAASAAASSATSARAAPRSSSALALRRWPPPTLPDGPWPLLLPYPHPDLLGGRARELAELVERLGEPQPLLALYGASGAGKSSLLAAGLVPALREAGRAVALERHPAERGLAGRLIAELLDGPPESLDVEDTDHATFVDRLLLARRRAGDLPPVLVLDQLEEVLRGDRRARAVVGTLFAATVQRRPGVAGAPCRWLLAYRWELHGELVHWLADPLREARALGVAGAEGLPHDLASPDRFHAWPLPPLGTPPPGAEGAATAAFLDAITAPLALRGARGGPRYPWRFEDGGAERLAEAFAEARARQPEAPLAPDLQVVLAHLVETAGEPAAGETAVLRVPGDVGRVIDDALETHLARTLDTAFPAADRIGRTRALLALRELADSGGRRGGSRDADELARAIGREGREVLDVLQGPRARLVVAERRGDELAYVLSHDRLAEVIVRAAEGGTLGGRLALDPELLALRRFVVLHSELFRAGERAQATRLSARHVAGIEAHAATLLVDAERRRWWDACRERRRRDARLRNVRVSLAAALLVVGAAALRAHVARRTARETLLAQIAGAEPASALAAVWRGLHEPSISADELRARLRARKAPLDVLESGMVGVPAAWRGEVVLEAGALALPLVGDPLRNAAPLASLLWALDYAPGRDPSLAGRAASLKARALAPLRKLRPPPEATDEGWLLVPAGTFRMGLPPGAKGTGREKPPHSVTLRPFLVLDHEVTNAEYRRLEPRHAGVDDHPVDAVSWYEAYVYSAWLGGRLPTEAEWECSARAGCRFEVCRQDGSEAAITDVAWLLVNTPMSANLLARAQSVKKKPANPWGLHDVYGNVLEFVADWYGPYSGGAQSDPWGPPSGEGRVSRGSSFRSLVVDTRPSFRVYGDPAAVIEEEGFRPVLPLP